MYAWGGQQLYHSCSTGQMIDQGMIALIGTSPEFCQGLVIVIGLVLGKVGHWNSRKDLGWNCTFELGIHCRALFVQLG